MLTIQYAWSSPISEATQFSLPLLPCKLPHRCRLRHYIIGLPKDAQLAIDRLHLLRYAERFEWSRAVPVVENGILIQPDAGDMLR